MSILQTVYSDSNDGVWITTAIVLTVATVVGYYWSFSQQKVTMVEGKLQCDCGKVCGQFKAPRESTPGGICHCHDCTGFVNWAVKEKGCKKNVSCFCSQTLKLLLIVCTRVLDVK